MTLGFYVRPDLNDTAPTDPTEGPADLWWQHLKKKPVMRRDTFRAARAAERLPPSEFRRFVEALPATIRSRLTGLDSFSAVMNDPRPWYSERLDCGLLFKQRNRTAKGLCIAFTGSALRFGVAPVLLASIFPRLGYDFAFIFDQTRACWRMGPDGLEGRVPLFQELGSLAEQYEHVLSAGHSGGAVPALEFHCFHPRAHVIAISPAPMLSARPKNNRSAANLSLAYDWVCNCQTFSDDAWSRRLIVASENSERDRGFAIQCGILANTRVSLLNGPVQHGIWRRRQTTLRMVRKDLDRFLRNVGL